MPLVSNSIHGSSNRICVLLPSSGLGGGIEAFADSVLAQIEAAEIAFECCILRPSGAQLSPKRRILFVGQCLGVAWRLRQNPNPQIVAFHSSFVGLSLFMKAVVGHKRTQISVFAYGIEIWNASWLTRRVWRLSAAQFISISSFTAGALAPMPSRLLPPGISPHRYELFLGVPPAPVAAIAFEILSVFRLSAAEGKGALTLLRAAEQLRKEGHDVRITLAGNAPVSEALLNASAGREGWVRIVVAPTDEALASLFRYSHLLVLATQLDSRNRRSGEGFGIVLTEAALAGRPAIAPSCDGSADAIIDGITGIRPVDSSVAALAEVLRWAIDHPVELEVLGKNARCWAKERFSPTEYKKQVLQALFGEPVDYRISLVLEDP